MDETYAELEALCERLRLQVSGDREGRAAANRGTLLPQLPGEIEDLSDVQGRGAPRPSASWPPGEAWRRDSGADAERFGPVDDRSGRALERRVEPAEQAADVRHRHLAQRGGQAAGAPLIGERASVLRIQGAGGSETAPEREPGGRPRESAPFEFVTGEVQDLEWDGPVAGRRS